MEKVLMFLSFFLGFLSVGLGVGAIVFANILSKRTDVLIKTEDERAKSLIRELGEMTKETQKMIERMDKRHQETMEYLGSLIKADGEKTRELINKILEKIPG
jgi:DNA-directed RNA polymerase subunit F